MNINQNLYKKHCNCEITVDRNYKPKKHRNITLKSDPKMYGLLHALTTTPPALICLTHRRWLKWLSHDEASAIESMIRA